MIDRPVLVLNQNYEPLNICLVRRALPLIFGGKAEMLENGAGFLRTASGYLEIPSVIRISHLVRRPRPQAKLTRAEIFHRDSHICQYCGKKAVPPTIDHVIPKNQNGEHSWENVVCACERCNRHKAGRTPAQANMLLLSMPKRPATNGLLRIPTHYLETMLSWRKYLPKDKRINN